MKNVIFVTILLIVCSAIPARGFTVEDSRSYALLESLLYETRAEPVVCVRWYPRAQAERNKVREQCFKFSKEAVCGGELDNYLVWPNFAQDPDPAQVEPEDPDQAQVETETPAQDSDQAQVEPETPAQDPDPAKAEPEVSPST